MSSQKKFEYGIYKYILTGQDRGLNCLEKTEGFAIKRFEDFSHWLEPSDIDSAWVAQLLDSTFYIAKVDSGKDKDGRDVIDVGKYILFTDGICADQLIFDILTRDTSTMPVTATPEIRTFKDSNFKTLDGTPPPLVLRGKQHFFTSKESSAAVERETFDKLFAALSCKRLAEGDGFVVQHPKGDAPQNSTFLSVSLLPKILRNLRIEFYQDQQSVFHIRFPSQETPRPRAQKEKEASSVAGSNQPKPDFKLETPKRTPATHTQPKPPSSKSLLPPPLPSSSSPRIGRNLSSSDLSDGDAQTTLGNGLDSIKTLQEKKTKRTLEGIASQYKVSFGKYIEFSNRGWHRFRPGPKKSQNLAMHKEIYQTNLQAAELLKKADLSDNEIKELSTILANFLRYHESHYLSNIDRASHYRMKPATEYSWNCLYWTIRFVRWLREAYPLPEVYCKALKRFSHDTLDSALDLEMRKSLKR